VKNLTETQSAVPMSVPKSIRPDEIRGVTSGFAGKVIPTAYIPVLREERVATSRVSINIDMTETVERLLNPISVTCRAVFVPHLAFDRFEGSLDRLNRSYKGEPDKDGGDVIPYFTGHAFDKDAEIYRTMGFHAKQGATVNAAIVESYNAYMNWRFRNISNKITERTLLDTTLAPSEWSHSSFRNIVADFDQAAIDGEVDLQIDAGRMYARTDQDGTVASAGINRLAGQDRLFFNTTEEATAIFTELADTGVALSLSNIEMAKKTAAYATFRKKYKDLDDDFVIDLLMEGIRVPDAQLATPIVLDKQTTMIGYSQRFATDGSNLAKSVTTGLTRLNMTVRTPAMNTGGIILFLVEIVPEQLFERQKDYFFHSTDVADLPNSTRDYLDPEKVAIVQNDHLDVEHTLPDTTFGYAPLNFQWKRSIPKIGGKYHRQVGDAFDENRQKIWAVETIDPALTSDFYLTNSLHHNVFADTTAEPFEITTLGAASIVGNIVYGKMLEENNGDYAAIAAQADDTRIDQTV